MNETRSAPRQQDLESFERRLLKRLHALNRQADTRGEAERIELALKRIGWGNYRLCAKCWEEIAPELLKEDATRITCAHCASAAAPTGVG